MNNITQISIDDKENGTVLFVNCRKHVITTYPTFIFMIYLTYGFGIYIFSHGGERQITKLAEKVVEVERTIKIISVHANA